MAKVYGAEIGKPDLQYVQFSYEDFKKSMVGQMGSSENMADLMNEFIKAMNDRKAVAGRRNAESTTPTTIHIFSKDFAQIYRIALVN
jgi:hypothetical protein